MLHLYRLNRSRFVERARLCTDAPRSSWKKRKVALIIGYLGTNYRGMQMAEPHIPTGNNIFAVSIYLLKLC
jgi:hypothetical protein